MEEIRQQKLAITDQFIMEEYLSKARTGFLGLSDNHHPYVIPLNYVWYKKCIYFHGANEGKKVRIMEKNNSVCFTICEELGTMSNPIPAKTDTAYWSIMIFGTVEKVEHIDDGRNIMQAMLDKYVPGYYKNPLSVAHLEKYESSLGSKTLLYKLTPKQITGKENKLDQRMKFSPGRTIDMDLKPVSQTKSTFN